MFDQKLFNKWQSNIKLIDISVMNYPVSIGFSTSGKVLLRYSLSPAPLVFQTVDECFASLTNEIKLLDPFTWIEENNHYKMIEFVGPKFSEFLCVPNITLNLSCDGDKTRQYKTKWEEAGVPFVQGTMIYLLSKEKGWCDTVRDTPHGWVAPEDWVIDQYRNNTLIQSALSRTFHWLKPIEN